MTLCVFLENGPRSQRNKVKRGICFKVCVIYYCSLSYNVSILDTAGNATGVSACETDCSDGQVDTEAPEHV